MYPKYHAIKADKKERSPSKNKILIQEYLVGVDLQSVMGAKKNSFTNYYG
jgi:hypothetical protein